MPLLYEDIDEQSAKYIGLLSDEIQNIKSALLKKFPTLDLTQVLPIGDRIISMYDTQIGRAHV